MPSLTYAHFCDFAFFDRFKKPCAVSFWDDQLLFQRMPGIIDKGSLLLRLDGLTPGSLAELTVLAKNETGASLAPMRVSGRIPEQSSTLVVIITLNGMKIHHYGNYRFEVQVDGDTAGAIVLRIEPSPAGSEHRNVIDLSGESE